MFDNLQLPMDKPTIQSFVSLGSWLFDRLQFPIENPTLIFSIVLAIILFAPLLLNKLRIPHIVGLILAGMFIGPHGFGIVLSDRSFEIFGRVGLLYLMFLASLEMNLMDFRENRTRGIVFGLLTFSVQMVLGTCSGLYILNFSLVSSVLLASMFASHTLITYPLLYRYGVTKQRSVTITISGTIITDLFALLILAIIVALHKGELSEWFWIKLIGSFALYLGFIIFTYPRLVKYFFKKYDDNILQFIFVLSLMFLAAWLAEVIGLEGIIGAFLAGIVLNRYIPKLSPLMNRIEFVGNALFIPYFLIGVGMMINLKVLFNGLDALIVVATMTVLAIFGKWLAAFFTQKIFSMSSVERQMIFGLSNSHAAATLAVVLIGFKVGILNGDVMNGAIILILVSCTVSSFVTEKAAKTLAVEQQLDAEEVTINERDERILIPVANPTTVQNLVNLALLMKDPKRKSRLYALSVTTHNNNVNGLSTASKVLDIAAQIASSADTYVKRISRIDMNIASGIVHTVKEKDITEVIIGLHHKSNIVDTFFGSMTESILKGTNRMITIAKCIIPSSMFSRIVVAVPEKAELETGFVLWVDRLANMTRQIGCRIIFYTTLETKDKLQKLIQKRRYNIRAEYQLLDDWGELLMLTDVVIPDDLFVIICARKSSNSYQSDFDKLPHQLSRYFADNNIALIYPTQFGNDEVAHQPDLFDLEVEGTTTSVLKE
jgi:Kef-type K+ transport system membrane component KefB